MSETYKYTGKPYTSFPPGPNGQPNDAFSSANSIAATINTPIALPAGLSTSDPLPEGIALSIRDGGKEYDNLLPGDNNPPPPYSGSITLSVQLSTDSTSAIIAWDIALNDNSFVEGMLITTSYGIHTSSGVLEAPVDESFISLNPGMFYLSGSTNVPGEWTHGSESPPEGT